MTEPRGPSLTPVAADAADAQDGTNAYVALARLARFLSGIRDRLFL